MPPTIINPLDGQYRALRTIQAPDHVVDASDCLGGFRISSAAFKPQSDGSISVDLEESLLRSGLDLMARYPALRGAVAMVSHLVQTLRDSGLTVDHVPVSGNDHHGEVRFDQLTRPQKRDLARKLADSCEFHVAIDGAEVARQRALRDAAKSIVVPATANDTTTA